MLPSLFIAHGAPSLALEQNEYTDYLKALAAHLPRPKAIVLFSAHWESTTQLISTAVEYDTIYDFSGFQDELYQVRYNAKGDQQTAKEVRELFLEQGLAPLFDEKRGLDHGAWVVLRLLYPDADIPVVSLSVNRFLSNSEQYRIGKALASLREQDILVIGSGGTVHNLRRLEWRSKETNDWAIQFDSWLEKTIMSWDTASLFDYERLAPYAKEAVPTPEHFIPLLLAMGSGDPSKKAELLYRSYMYGNLSHSIWKFH
jgi:4,5-DOPA dioxygenase extradiol